MYGKPYVSRTKCSFHGVMYGKTTLCRTKIKGDQDSLATLSIADSCRLQCPLDFNDCVRLDYIADLDVVVAADVKAALHTGSDLLGVVLEPLE